MLSAVHALEPPVLRLRRVLARQRSGATISAHAFMPCASMNARHSPRALDGTPAVRGIRDGQAQEARRTAAGEMKSHGAAE